MSDMALHYRVTHLLNAEADCLDQWRLDDWLTLFTDDAEYFVPPTDVDGDSADPDKALFYVMDDRRRMEERVTRLKKRGAHSEWPRSRVRHLISNIIATHSEPSRVTARASFIVYRSKDATSDAFVGHYLYDLREREGELLIRKKTCVLDLEALRPHGRISIIL
jgi:p-cumate 2,3-dioxygenase beta subunit